MRKRRDDDGLDKETTMSRMWKDGNVKRDAYFSRLFKLEKRTKTKQIGGMMKDGRRRMGSNF